MGFFFKFQSMRNTLDCTKGYKGTPESLLVVTRSSLTSDEVISLWRLPTASDASVSCSGRGKLCIINFSFPNLPHTKPQSHSLQSVKPGTSATPGHIPLCWRVQEWLQVVSLDPIRLGSFLLLLQDCHMALHPPMLVSVQLCCKFFGPKMMPNKVLASKPGLECAKDRVSGCFSSTNNSSKIRQH